MTRQAGAKARARILEGAVRRITDEGIAGASLADVAAASGVSKALIHYHFGDRDSLLAAVIAQVGTQLVERQRAALHGERTPLAVDSLWAWIRGELEGGNLALLVELGACRTPRARAEVEHVGRLRREATTQTVERLFAALGLTPRVPAAMIASVTIAFLDGLAVAHPRGAAPDDARVAYDVFWLAMLNLAD